MNESVSAELRERARRRRVQGPEGVSIDEIREWLAAEARASEHPFIRRVAAGALAELDAARARVAELEAIERRARELADAGREDGAAGPYRHAARYILGEVAQGSPFVTNFEGHDGRECGEHRTTGQRAWCHTCSEWCYPDEPCKGCELPQLRARVAELKAENARLRGLLRGPADPRMLHLSPLIIPERSPMSRDAGAYAENHHGWVIPSPVGHEIDVRPMTDEEIAAEHLSPGTRRQDPWLAQCTCGARMLPLLGAGEANAWEQGHLGTRPRRADR